MILKNVFNTKYFKIIWKFSLLLIIASLIFSCSFYKKKRKEEATTLSTSSDTIPDSTSTSSTISGKSELESLALGASNTESSTTDSSLKSDMLNNEVISKNTDESISSEVVHAENNQQQYDSNNQVRSTKPDMNAAPLKYKIEKGDTFMWISFKIYGDYQYWKSISNLNKEINTKGLSLPEGTEINYYPPLEIFKWNPEGDPYMILKNDTLGIISKKVYETPKLWKEIWNNNKLMIKNPNLIFAGFTIFCLPKEKLSIDSSLIQKSKATKKSKKKKSK